MNARRLQRFEELLKAERARIVGALDRIASAVPATGEVVANPGDDTAAGAIGTGPEDDAAVLARESQALREVDEALRVLRESPHDYGICAQCGRPIPDERLELLPATRVCGR
jgi:RNA polymerase-binding transcription factor DksA